MDKRGFTITLLAIVLFVTYLWWSNPFQAFSELESFSLNLFVIAIIVDFIGLFFFVFSWHLLNKALDIKIELWESIQICFTSLFVGWIVPIPMNTEVVRAYLLTNKTGSNMGKSISSVFVHRAFYNISFGIIITLTAFFVILSGKQIPIKSEIVVFLVFFAIISSIFFSLILNPRILERLYSLSPNWIKHNIFDRLYNPDKSEAGFKRVIFEVEEAIITLSKKMKLSLLSFICVSIHWGLGAITAWIVAYSMGVHLEIWVTVFIYAVIEFIQQINWVIPSGLGIVDTGLTEALVFIGIPLSLSAAISLLIRFATNWIELIVYIPVAFHYGYKEIVEKLKSNVE